MNLALTVLEITAPVFLLAGVGFVWVKAGFEYRNAFVTRLAMTLAVPALIFTALMQAEVDPGKLAVLAGASLVTHIAIALIGWLVLRAWGLTIRTYLPPFIFGNTGNLGLPLALFAFGQTGLEYAVVVLAVSVLLTFTLGVWLVAGQGSPLKMLREPMIWATLLGALFLWQDWETPRFLTNTLELLGQMAIPLMLLTLGVAVARLSPASFLRAAQVSLAKLAVSVALAWGIGLAFGLTGIAFGVLVVQTATPVAVTLYLLADKYEADADAVAGVVVVSTLLGVGALPLLLAVLL